MGLDDGTVAAIVQDAAAAHQVVADNRHIAVFTLDEIGKLLNSHREVLKAKLVFPGCTVTRVTPPLDPLDEFRDGATLDAAREVSDAPW